jgi:hypothetical protein
MRVLFLDFDGVLNSNQWLLGTVVARRSAVGRDPAAEIDPARVEILNKIVAATGAKIVFSTSWRCAYSDERLMEFLRSKGFVGECIGRTIEEFPDGEIFRSREEEIFEWLESWSGDPVESWIAIDDCNLSKLKTKNFVRTDVRADGLTERDACRAISLLRGEES